MLTFSRPALYPFRRTMFTLTCCSNYSNDFWLLMSAMFGYQDDPSPLEWMFYFVSPPPTPPRCPAIALSRKPDSLRPKP